MTENTPLESSPATARSCERCRAALGAQDRFCQECGAPAGVAAGRACRACGAALRLNARFCPQCGAQAAGGAAGWKPGLHAGWERARARAAAVDWTRVGRVAAPALTLLLAGLIGYGIGQRTGEPPTSPAPVVSGTRGWRSATANSAPHPGQGGVGGSRVARLEAPAAPGNSPGSAPAPNSRLTRFRDFHIGASSWELANPPILAADGDPYTAWHAWETERFSQGDWLTLTFPTPRVISRIGLIPGRIGSRARQDGRVRSILVKAPGAPPQKLIFTDEPRMQYRDLKQPVLTRKLILRILTVLPGSRSSHIIIPEVQAWGYPAQGQVVRRPGPRGARG